MSGGMLGRSIFIVSFTALLISGCARTVTVRPDVGSRISIEITFRGDVSTSNNRYYMVFGGAAPVFTNKNSYFFAPGEEYDREKLDVSSEAAYYYDNFFSTWSDFVTLRNETFYMNNGPFTSAADHSSYSPSLLSYRTIPSAGSEAAKKIELIFDLSKFPPPLPTELYFNFLSVGSDGRLKDLLGATDNKTSVNVGSSAHNISEVPDMAIDGGLDIISWKVEIQ